MRIQNINDAEAVNIGAKVFPLLFCKGGDVCIGFADVAIVFCTDRNNSIPGGQRKQIMVCFSLWGVLTDPGNAEYIVVDITAVQKIRGANRGAHGKRLDSRCCTGLQVTPDIGGDFSGGGSRCGQYRSQLQEDILRKGVKDGMTDIVDPHLLQDLSGSGDQAELLIDLQLQLEKGIVLLVNKFVKADFLTAKQIGTDIGSRAVKAPEGFDEVIGA